MNFGRFLFEQTELHGLVEAVVINSVHSKFKAGDIVTSDSSRGSMTVVTHPRAEYTFTFVQGLINHSLNLPIHDDRILFAPRRSITEEMRALLILGGDYRMVLGLCFL